MSAEPPPSVAQKERYLRQLQQTIIALDQNRRALRVELEEVKLSLEELNKSGKGAVVYKQFGRLLIKSDLAKVKQELTEKQKSLENYLRRLELQYNRAVKKIKEFQAKDKTGKFTLVK